MRLLSYNIHKGIGGRDRRYRLERIADVIESQNPDFCCLQEVTRLARRSKFDHQPKILSRQFALQHVLFQLNVRYGRGGYGNLLLSRWPIRRHHQVSLRMKEKKSRGAQLAVIDTPEGLLHLSNWHLGLSERERHWQAGHLLTHRLFRENAELPTLLAGDTNDWRDTLKRAALAEHGFEHVTHPISRFRTFPAWMPVGSLDKAYACAKIKIRHAHVVHSRLARVASDHLPLVIDFHLEH